MTDQPGDEGTDRASSRDKSRANGDGDTPAARPKTSRRSEQPDATLIRCSHCGALNSADFDRCVRCTEPLPQGPAPSGAAPARAEPRAGGDDAPRAAGPRRQRRRAPSLLAVLAPGSGLPATKLLFGLTTLVFLAHLAVSLRRELSLTALLLGGSPVDAVRFGALVPGSPQLLAHEPWRLCSAVFVHFGILHFAVNMAGLLYLGRIAEPAIGPTRYLLVYLATGLLGFATTAVYFTLTAQNGLTAGASGALFGVMGLILGIMLRRRDPRWKMWATQAVLFSVLFGFALRVANNSAHLGGLGVGVLLGLVLARSASKAPPRWQRVAAIAGLIGTVVCLVLAQLSPLWSWLEQTAATVPG